MNIEIEKKYDITEHDLKIIEQSCDFISEKEIIDEYFDTDEYILFKNYYHLRKRNDNYELKIETTDRSTGIDRSQEYETLEEINEQLKKFHINITHTIGQITIRTIRKKYSYEYKGYTVIFDIDDFELGSRYEIEILVKDDENVDGNKIIEDLRNHLGLTAPLFTQPGKAVCAAKKQNPAAYKVLLER
ncbi:CYTH domain-containing protein [Candidatus Gracilibacteria bacterium]|nr:CYTH domain-containing protein [Candidatus Gracilibacteria bacterium]